MIICSTILALLFISTGVVHTLQQTENFHIYHPDETQELTFEKAFYFMIITITTVGYGDMAPETNLARAIIGIFIIVVIVITTQQTSRLGELISRTSPYRSPYKAEPNSYIVITGSFNGTTLYRFLKEFYHPDHDMPMKKCKVLLVGNESPGKDIVAILNHPLYEEVVTYHEGDFLSEFTLKNAGVGKCKGVFIITNQYEQEVAPKDTYALLACNAVKEYSSSTDVYLQLVRPDLLIHDYWAGWTTGFSTWRLKLFMLAANVFTPGFSTLISNLVISSSGIMKKEAENNHWLNEYVLGLSNELYLVKFPNSLLKHKFSDIALALYLKHNSLLIGVQTKRKYSEEVQTEIVINPVDYYISKGDQAFIIAPDIEDARGIEDCSLKDFFAPETPSEVMEELFRMQTKPSNETLFKQLDSRYIAMWETDLRGVLWNHIIVIGRIEHLEIILEPFSTTKQLVCFLSDKPPGDKWERIKANSRDCLYLECCLTDVEELSRTAINFSSHVILLSSRISGSSMEDSGILPVVNIIESNFSCRFTVELVDEVNMKYLDHKPPIELESLSFTTWPRYAASEVFFSSTLDYMIAQSFHNPSIIDIIQRLIIFEDLYAQLGIDENYRINSIDLPEALHGKVTFADIFCYLVGLERPVLALGIYRGVGYLNNEVPYVFTKPDPNTPLFLGDKIIVMGEMHQRENSPYLKEVKKRSRKDTVIDFGKKRSITKYSQNFLVRKATAADNAQKLIEDEEKDDYQEYSDEQLLQMISGLLNKTKKEREVIAKQNETLMNLTSEYSTIQNLLHELESQKGFGLDLRKVSEEL